MSLIDGHNMGILVSNLQPGDIVSSGGESRLDDDVELCPRWWPWPWPHHALGAPVEGPRPEPWDEIPAGGQVSLQMFRALTMFNMAYQYHDGEAQARIQGLAVKQLSELTGKLENAGRE